MENSEEKVVNHTLWEIEENYEFYEIDKNKTENKSKIAKEIPHMFNFIDWKTEATYKLRISHIYDPFKFWVVLKYQELDLFQSYLHNVYNNNFSQYKIPVKRLKLHMYCIVYTNNTFYRGKIINFPFQSSFTQTVQVFLIDFGYVCVVPCSGLLRMCDNMYSVPQFAVRASLLMKLEKHHNESPWPDSVVDKFVNLTYNQILLGKIMTICEKRKCIYVKLGVFNEEQAVVDISSELHEEQQFVSTLETEKPNKPKAASKYIVKVNCLRSLPPFELIESGRVPPSHKTSQILLRTNPPDVIYPNYYEYKS